MLGVQVNIDAGQFLSELFFCCNFCIWFERNNDSEVDKCTRKEEEKEYIYINSSSTNERQTKRKEKKKISKHIYELNSMVSEQQHSFVELNNRLLWSGHVGHALSASIRWIGLNGARWPGKGIAIKLNHVKMQQRIHTVTSNRLDRNTESNTKHKTLTLGNTLALPFRLQLCE